MALSVLDGNQSATTLSSVVTGGEHIVAHSVVSLGTTAIANITSAVSGVNITGTVTANVGAVDQFALKSALDEYALNYNDPWPIKYANTHEGDPFPISGTVTVGNAFFDGDGNLLVSLAPGTNPYTQPISGTVTVGNSVTIGSLPAISGTVTANLPVTEAWAGIYDSGNDCIKIELANLNGDTISPSNPLPISGTVTVGNSVTIGSLPAISGTVTANNPNGALTTRFGSVTTANTAQITSAVTNASRKYLLTQNISAGTVTIGIGFSPTTTQGIQLTAGGGLTFDAFCPTGAVYWLGAVTGAAWTILEG